MAEENVNEQHEKRILILGSAPHTRLVTAYTWDNLPSNLNVADYDVVILNLVPFLDTEFARSIELDTLPSFRDFARFLFSEGSEIIAIGVPGLEIGNNPYQYTEWWLPVVLTCIFDGGRQVRDIYPEFDFYFQYVNSWLFHISKLEQSIYLPDYLKTISPVANVLRAGLGTLAATRFQKPIAFRLRFVAASSGIAQFFCIPIPPSGEVKEIPESSAISGDIIWLPPTTEIHHYDAVGLILRERYGLCLEQAAPDWVEPYKLPDQLPIEDRITQFRQEIQQLNADLATAQQQLGEAAHFQKLLYEQGKDVLEPVVRDALRELGAQVHDPKDPSGDDGRLVDPSNRQYTLEITGTIGVLKIDKVRQLRHWVDDASLSDSWESKGLLIANLRCGDQIGQRDEMIPQNQAQGAENFDQCVMTTTQLFRALCSHQRGELDIEEFWNTIFNTNGVCPLPELEPVEKEAPREEGGNA